MPYSPFIEIFKMFMPSDSIARVHHEWLDQECIDRTGALPPTQLQCNRVILCRRASC